MNWSIRESRDDERADIKAVHLDAFGAEEGPSVSQLAVELLVDQTAEPVVSLVAELDDQIVGHVIFSGVTVAGHEGVQISILCPLAVLSRCHGRRIGQALVERGLHILRERGSEIVLVYGDPGYYGRFGFRAGHQLQPPFTLEHPPEAWMARELKTGSLSQVAGKIHCAACLNSPAHW